MSERALRCRACGENGVQISNRAVVEERDRLLRLSDLPSRGSCTNTDCDHCGRDVEQHPNDYQSFGRSTAGSQRYRCKACRKTFSVHTRSDHRLRQPEVTLDILRFLINRVAMRRMCALAGVSADTLYQRIGLIHERCRQFAARRERALLLGKPLDHMHIAFDRQQHVLNWGSSLDRRPTIVMSSASADARSGYVLAQHVNFDPMVDPFELDLAARAAGDPAMPMPFRQYARVWLPYEQFDRAASSVEAVSTGHGAVRAASRGAMVHEAVALAAHFQVLKRMLAGAKSVQISSDRESGIERSVLVTFAEEVRGGRLDLFLVRLDKELTEARKVAAVAEAEQYLAQQCAARPDLSELEVIRALISERYLATCTQQTAYRERWVAHPFATKSEPGRAAVCLTAGAGRSLEHLVHGFARASLRSVDRYFMQVRRMVHLLERPTSSASSAYRVFHAYSPYSALVVSRILEIFRVVYNYHARPGRETTPAMALGLAEQPFELAELLDDPLVS